MAWSLYLLPSCSRVWVNNEARNVAVKKIYRIHEFKAVGEWKQAMAIPSTLTFSYIPAFSGPSLQFIPMWSQTIFLPPTLLITISPELLQAGLGTFLGIVSLWFDSWNARWKDFASNEQITIPQLAFVLTLVSVNSFPDIRKFVVISHMLSHMLS